MFFESEYNYGTMTFSEWIIEAEKCDYYRSEILKLKNANKLM